jgi:hypothetical protein
VPMTATELFEDIRARLNELPVNTVSTPWAYRPEELVHHARTAMRYLRASGVVVTPTLDGEGALSAPLSDTIGVLVSLLTSASMVRGNLLKKLGDGELGVVFRTGADLIDTKTAAIRLESAADEMATSTKELMAIALASTEQAEGSVGAYLYGEREPYPG